MAVNDFRDSLNLQLMVEKYSGASKSGAIIFRPGRVRFLANRVFWIRVWLTRLTKARSTEGSCCPADSFMTAEGDFGTFRPGIAGLVGKNVYPIAGSIYGP